VPLANTAYGDNTMPQISWSNLPEGTVQLALLMDDPVAPTPVLGTGMLMGHYEQK
jgi:hypothetical protein